MPGELNEQHIRKTVILLGLPVDFIRNALRKNAKWEEHWVEFLEQMVYQPDKPTFDQAVSVVERLMPLNIASSCGCLSKSHPPLV